MTLKTAGKPAKLLLVADKPSVPLTPDWNDVRYVTATLVDEAGTRVPDSVTEVQFAAKGAGSVIAVDNGNMQDHEPFQATERRLYDGNVCAIVRGTGAAGNVTVTCERSRCDRRERGVDGGSGVERRWTDRTVAYGRAELLSGCGSMWTRRQFVATSTAAAAGSRLATGFGWGQQRVLPFIDSHVHVWKHDARFPFAAGAHVPAEDASVEMLLALMEANEVLAPVMIQVIHYRYDNAYLADVLRRYPQKFHGVCRVDPDDPNAPDELRRLTEEHGFRGVRLSPAAGAAGRLDSRAQDGAAVAEMCGFEGADDAADSGGSTAGHLWVDRGQSRCAGGDRSHGGFSCE